MAHYKRYLRYEAYNTLGGHFPSDRVIFYFKGYGCTKRDFEEIAEERFNIAS